MKTRTPILSICMLGSVLAGSSAGAVELYSHDYNLQGFGDATAQMFSSQFTVREEWSLDTISIKLAHDYASELELSLTSPGSETYYLLKLNGARTRLGDGTGTLAGAETFVLVESGALLGSVTNWDFSGYKPGGTYDALEWPSGTLQPGLWTIALRNVDKSGFEGGAVGTLTIGGQTPVSCIAVSEGMIAWWRAESNSWDSIGGFDGQYPPGGGSGSYVTGRVGSAFNLNQGNYVRVPAGSRLDLGNAQGFTVEGWIRRDAPRWSTLLEWGDERQDFGASLRAGDSTDPTTLEARFPASSSAPIETITLRSEPGVLSSQVWQHIALSYDKPSGTAAIYGDGVLVAKTNLVNLAPVTGGDFHLGGAPNTVRFFGAMDEFSLYNRALTSTELHSIHDAGGNGKCPPPAKSCEPLPEGAVAWWPGESSTWDVIGAHDAAVYPPISPFPIYTNGRVGSAFSFIFPGFLTVPGSRELDVGAGNGFTFETWILPLTYSSGGICGWGGSSPGQPYTPQGVRLTIQGGSLAARLVKTNGQTIAVSTPTTVVPNSWQHVALSCDIGNGDVSIYVNGQLVTQRNIGPGPLLTSGFFSLGNVNGSFLPGWMDEPTLYNRALSGEEIHSIQRAGAAGKCAPPRLVCLPPPADIAAWWRGESNSVDIVAGNHGTMSPLTFPAPLAYQNGRVGQGFKFAGRNHVSVPPSETLDVGSAGGLTFEAWINPAQLSPMPIIEWADTNRLGPYLWLSHTRGPGALEANLVDAGGGSHPIYSPPNSVAANSWEHVALTYDRITGAAALYVNGDSVASTNLGSFSPRTDTSLFLGYNPYSGLPLPGVPTPLRISFSGGMDEASIYHRALTADEVRSIAKSRRGKCPELPPTIGGQPLDEVTLEGGVATFELSVGGTEPISYQWFFEGMPLTGANASILSIMRPQPGDAGNYWATASNAFGMVTSRVASLTVLPANKCLPPPDGAVAWWKGEGNEWDEFQTHDAVWGLNLPTGFTEGLVGQSFRFMVSSYLQVPADPGLDVARDEFTFEGWIKPDFAFQRQAILDWNDGHGTVGVGLMLSSTGPGALEVTLTDTNTLSQLDQFVTLSTPLYTIGSQTNPSPGWTHVALTFNRAGGRVSLFVNGSVAAERIIAPVRTRTSPLTPEPFTPATTGDLYFGWRRSGPFAGPRFVGAMDELTVYDRALSRAEVRAIYTEGSNGKCAPPPTPCMISESDIAGWWRGESNALDSVSVNHGQMVPSYLPATVAYTTGQHGAAFQMRSGNYLVVSNTPDLDVGSGPGLTVEAWINPINSAYPVVGWHSGTLPPQNATRGVYLATSASRGPGYLEANLIDDQGQPHVVLSPFMTPVANQWRHVAVTYDKASGEAELYVNGSAVTQTNVGSFTPQTTGNLYLGHQPLGPNPPSVVSFIGSMDEVTVYRRALTAAELRCSYRNGEAGKYPAPADCVPPTQGIVSWWRFESNLLDSVADNDRYSYWGVGDYTNGQIGRALLIAALSMPMPSNFNLAGGAGLTVEGWINPASNISSFFQSAGLVWFSNLRARLWDTNGIVHTIEAPSGLVQTSKWQHVALTYDKASGFGSIYLNGMPVASTDLGSFTPRAASSFWLGSPAVAGAWLKVDEIAIYNQALSPFEIHSIYSSQNGRCMEAPMITKQSESIRVNVGSDVAFNVEATGNPLLRYQWFKDGRIVARGREQIPVTGPSLALTSVVESDQGTYQVVVTNAFGSAVSSNAVLLVNYPPVANAEGASTLLVLPPCTNEIVAVLDGSQSSDPDEDLLDYRWFATNSVNELATGVVAVVKLPAGTHEFELVVDDGLLKDTNRVRLEVLTVEEAVRHLICTVVDSGWNKKQSLLASLDAAQGSISKGHLNAAVNQLEAFQNKARARVSPKNPELAGALIRESRAIIAAIIKCDSSSGHKHPHLRVKRGNASSSMEFEAEDSGPYIVEASCDMIHWERIGIAKPAGGAGRFEFEDENAWRYASRYYRIVTP